MNPTNNVTVQFNGVDIGLNALIQQSIGGLQQFQDAVGNVGSKSSSSMSALGSSFNNFAQQGKNALDMVTGPMDPLISRLEQVANRAGMVLETMTLWRGFDFVTQQIESWTQALFELNNTMERTQTGWMFLFGTGNNASSMGIAQGLADYTKRESFNIPFTRQDMLQAITSLATTNPNAAIVEKYLPLIADFASTRTNFAGQPLTLGQAAYSLVGAQEGYTRMLKYDLKINPEDLKKLGWNEKDPNTLFPALQKYADERHITGASKYIATHTWFGEKSSFEDRIQNFQLMAGQGMFKTLEGDLNSFTSWWDQHQHQLDSFATMMGTTIADGLKKATGAAKEFFQGWSSQGERTVQGLMEAMRQGPLEALVGSGPGLRADLASKVGIRGRSAAEAKAAQAYLAAHPLLGLAGEAGYAAHGLLGDLGAAGGGFLQGGSGVLNILIQPMKDLANVLNNPAVKEGFATIGQFLGELAKVRLDTSLSLLSGFLEGLGKSGLGQAVANLAQSLERLLSHTDPLVKFVGLLAEIAGGAIGGGLAITANGLSRVADFLTMVVSNKVGLAIVEGILTDIAAVIATKMVVAFIQWSIQLGIVIAQNAALAVELAGDALSALTGFVTFMATDGLTALAGWSAAMWDVAAANLAATWEFLLIVAVLAAVAYGIMELIQHWDDVTKALGRFKNAIGDFLGGAGRRIGDFFNGLGTDAHNALVTLEQAPGRLGSAIGTAWDEHVTKPIETAFVTLVIKALHWGEELIHNIATGIQNGLHWLQDAVNQAIKPITDHFQHSVPKEGPLKDEIQWGEHMMANIATGMVRGIPLVASASVQAAAAIGVPLTSAALGNVSTTSYGNYSPTINIQASDYQYVLRIAHDALAMQHRQDSLATHAPGGFRTFGYTG